jgi:hypothetical protein
MIPDKEGRAQKVDPKPGSDYPYHRTTDWDRDCRVRLPHDHLVKSYAITQAQFEAMA